LAGERKGAKWKEGCQKTGLGQSLKESKSAVPVGRGTKEKAERGMKKIEEYEVNHRGETLYCRRGSGGTDPGGRAGGGKKKSQVG